MLNGISLERYVKQFGPMPPARVAYLLRQVCHSLDEAHDRGLLHRDIKPANIFMCRLGPDDDFVKVLDFGLVKQYRQRDPGTLPTVEEIVAGTPAFMAPELALSVDGADGRADIYALGCVAYYLLTGQTVFSGGSSVAVLIAHVNETPVPPSSRSSFAIPASLDTLILDCLAKDAARRPYSAGDLAQRLADCLPAEAWTPASARLWWQAHPDVLQAQRECGCGDVKTPTSVKRCWPRLDLASRH